MLHLAISKARKKYIDKKSGDHAQSPAPQTEALRLPFPVERATTDPTPI